MKLNLGCGREKLPGYVNVDLAKAGPDVPWDLEQYPWPFDDSTVDEVLLKHVVEHIRDLIPFMNELWRVCAPHAIVRIECPYYLHHRAVMDPTHVRYICEASLQYFNQDWLRWVGLMQYDILANFKINEISYRYAPEWADKPDKDFFRQHYANVVEDIFFVLEAIK